MAQTNTRRPPAKDALAEGLGWFSLALGVALLASPGGIARAIGAPDNAATRRTLGFVGVREIAAGVTILTDPVLCNRVGADTVVGTIGAKRLVAPALKARQLPPIDLVLLSHAHMDHLDPATLRATTLRV